MADSKPTDLEELRIVPPENSKCPVEWRATEAGVFERFEDEKASGLTLEPLDDGVFLIAGEPGHAGSVMLRFDELELLEETLRFIRDVNDEPEPEVEPPDPDAG